MTDITQADRDAAAAIYQNFRDHDYAGWVRDGTNAGGDHDWVIQTVAKRYEAGFQAGVKAGLEAAANVATGTRGWPNWPLVGSEVAKDIRAIDPTSIKDTQP